MPAAGYRFHAVAAAPMQREVSVASASAPFVRRSVRTCLPIVRPADVVVGMGGYVSVAPVIAARWAHRPIVLHEQNAIPSLANRLLARFATAVGVTFGSSRASFGARVRTEMTGNPVRAQVTARARATVELPKRLVPRSTSRPDGRPSLVFGGSQGALHIDQVVAGSPQHLRHRDDLQVIVLTGRDHLDVVASAATDVVPLLVRPMPFLDRMELALAVADLAVARAGAGHIAELTDAGSRRSSCRIRTRRRTIRRRTPESSSRVGGRRARARGRPVVGTARAPHPGARG